MIFHTFITHDTQFFINILYFFRKNIFFDIFSIYLNEWIKVGVRQGFLQKYAKIIKKSAENRAGNVQNGLDI